MGLSIFRIVTLAAALEAVLVLKILAGHSPPGYEGTPLLPLLVIIFGINYGILSFYHLAIFPVFFDPLRKLPGPKYGYWVHILMIWSRIAKRKIPAQIYSEWAQDIPNEGVLAFQGFGRTSLILTRPSSIATVLINRRSDYIKPPLIRKFLGFILGDGMVLAEHEKHKVLRKNTQPAFAPSHIKDLYPMMLEKARNMTEGLRAGLKSKAGGEDNGNDGVPTGSVDMNYWGTRVSLDIIGQACLGRDFNCLENSEDQLSRDYEFLMEPTIEKILWYFLNSKLSYRMVQLFPWKLNKLMWQRITSVRRICHELVKEKRSTMSNTGDDRFDILSLLIKSNNFSEEQLTDQILTFLVAGHETTSSAFVWATFLLAINPQIQTALRNEVRGALAEAKPLGLASILETLPILNGVIHETLRLYPTAPLLLRVAEVDTNLVGVLVPKGTTIVIPPWTINRSLEFWGDDAEGFCPQHWIDANGKPNNTGGGKIGILTFLHGPRSCIGENFSKAELRCLISAMVNSLEWELDMRIEDVIPAGAVTIRPGNGVVL